MAWVNDVAGEIDRLVVATHERAGALFSGHPLAGVLRCHPAVVNALGLNLLRGPVPVASLGVIYPYLPQKLLDLLVDNNVDEKVVTRDGDQLVLTVDGRRAAELANELLDESAGFCWTDAGALGPIEAVAGSLVSGGLALDPPARPSAFVITAAVTDRPTQAGRVFRLLSALRYWRADAHRAAWAARGLSVQEAHALNRLWDIGRGVERVGQGDPRPGSTGVAALTERGWVVGGALSDAGREAREAIEADTDARTEPLYASLADAARAAFLDGLRALPIH